MLKRLLSLTLAGLLLNLSVAVPVCAETREEKDARRAEKVKRAVEKLGTGEKARVKVRLKDGTRLKGYVEATGADDFQLKDAESGTTTRVAFADVKQLEGRNLSTGAKVAIGLGIAAGVLVVVFLIGLHEVRSIRF